MEAIFLSSDIKSLCRFAILGLIFALNGCVYACIPIIFYRPAFLCGYRDEENSPDGEIFYSICSEAQACSSSNQFPFKTLSEYSQINSVSMEFELYCGDKIIEATILTVMAAGQIFAFIIGTGIYIHPKKQYDYFIKGNTITGICLVMSYFATSAYLLLPILFIWNLYYGLYMSVIFAHLNFFFSGALSKFGPAIYNTGWPAFMLVYCLFTYYYGYWKDSLVLFAGIPYLILTVLLVYFKAPAIVNRHTNTSLGVAVNQAHTNNINAAIKKSENFGSEIELIQQDSTPAFLPLISNNNTNSNQAPSKTEAEAIKLLKNNSMELSKYRTVSGLKKSKKTGLNKRLLNADKHEISINQPAASQLSSLQQLNSIEKEFGPVQDDDIDNKNQPSIKRLESSTVSSSAWGDFKKQLLSIKSNPKYLKNIVLFVLCWLGTNIAYFGCLLVMSDLGGNIYTNVAMSTVFEFAGNLSAAFLIIKFPQHKILKLAFLIVGIAYMACLIQDPTKQDVEAGYSAQVILSLIPIVIAKGTHEMLWTVLQTYLNTILPVEFHQFSFACSNLVSVFVMDLLPFYKFLMEYLEFNQFVGYSLYCLFTCHLIDYFEDLYRDDGKPICPMHPSEIEMHIIETDYIAQRETDRQKQLRREILEAAQHTGLQTI